VRKGEVGVCDGLDTLEDDRTVPVGLEESQVLSYKSSSGIGQYEGTEDVPSTS
jgi:hypothetical protein